MVRRTAEGDHLTALVLEVFKLNGRLLSAGDRLVEDLGLTSARWQVLGAATMSATPQPVANIARIMGLTRQAVQRVANDLHALGLVQFEPNPHHQRAQLVVPTQAGRRTYELAHARQIPWSDGLAEGLDEEPLQAALRVARELNRRLDARPSGARRGASIANS